MNHTYELKGAGHTFLDVNESSITIRRKGMLNFINQGLKGEKAIPLSSIRAIQIKKPGLTSGYIQFSITGGNESKGGVFEATADENTVMFVGKNSLLEKQFNSDNDKIVTVDVKTDVVDDQSKDNKPHEEIKVVVKDKDTIEKLKTDKNAIDNDNASDDQKMYIAGIQDIISDAAKKLNNNADTITFGYKMDADNTMLIAGSSRTKDFVKPVEINIE